MFASPANRIDSLRCGNSLVSGAGLRLSFGDDLWFRLKQYLPTRKITWGIPCQIPGLLFEAECD